MDNLKDTLANISLYEVKAYVRKAQNAVMNYTEMEAKVREATNNEPWGASNTFMQEIADGTNSYSQFHEIMPMIYKRFTEKSAEEWRQIYKALQLLEFLVKNGSERVVDYARSHSAVIDMLKHFHYIDQNGKDQGINIRNRAKELTALLSDVDKIRAERKKARSNKVKYSGMGNGGFGGTGKQYGGFGSDALQYGGGGYENRVFGDGGGFGGSNYSGPGYDNNNDDDYEEYEVEGVGASSSSSGPSKSTRSSAQGSSSKAKEPIPDIISFDDEDDFSAPQSAPPAQQSGVSTAAADDDDEFDDFQSATATTSSATTTSASNTKSQITDLFNSIPQSQPQPQQQFQQPQAPLGGMSMASMQPPSSSSSSALGGFPTSSVTSPGLSSNSSMIGGSASGMANPSTTSLGSNNSQQSQKKKAADDAFGSLWTSASAKSKKSAGSQDNSKASLSSLAQQSVQNSMWGQQSQSQSQSQPQSQPQSQNDDLLSF